MLSLFVRRSRRKGSNSPRHGEQLTRRHEPASAPDWRGEFERLEDRTLLTVTLTSSYTGLDVISAASGGFIFTPPDTCGAAGPTSYVETSNQAVRIYTPKATGASSVTRSMDDFLFTQGGLDSGQRQFEIVRRDRHL